MRIRDKIRIFVSQTCVSTKASRRAAGPATGETPRHGENGPPGSKNARTTHRGDNRHTKRRTSRKTTQGDRALRAKTLPEFRNLNTFTYFSLILTRPQPPTRDRRQHPEPEPAEQPKTRRLVLELRQNGAQALVRPPTFSWGFDPLLK